MKRHLKILRSHHKRLPGKGRPVQWLRRCVQLGVLVVLIAVPALSLYANMDQQRDERGIASHWYTRAIAAVDQGAERPAWIEAVRGSTWTIKVGDRVISDPLAALDFAAATKRPFDGFMLTAAIPLLLTLLLGRVFCGWLCPADLIFEIGSTVRRWAGIETDVKFPRALKYVVLALGLLAAVLVGTQWLAEIYPPRLVAGELYNWVTFGVLGVGAWFMLALVAFEIFVSRRFWCRYVCPGGALFSALGSARVVRMTVLRDACTDCGKCQPACEFGLDPSQGSFGPECNNCGQCIRACAPAALKWRVALPRGGGDRKDRAA